MTSQSLNKPLFNLVNNFIFLLGPKIINNVIIKLKTKTIILHIDKSNLNFVLDFFKNHINYQFKTLVSITGVDYPNKTNRDMRERFEIYLEFFFLIIQI